MVFSLLQSEDLLNRRLFVGLGHVIVFIEIDFTKKENVLASNKEQSALDVGVEILYEKSFDRVL